MAMKTNMSTVVDNKTWGVTELPIFKNKKALILPGAFYGPCVALFAECGFGKAETVEEADLVVFIGGADIDPALYGQKPLPKTFYHKSRDDFEVDIFIECVRLKKPMYGICRGAQFLQAMNGGELWQHVEGHAGPDHLIYDIEEDCYVKATSVHHQMLSLNDRIDVLACTKDQISRKFYSDTMVVDLDKPGDNNGVEIEIEAGAYHDTRCLFVQGHPEIGCDEYRSWCMVKLYDFLREIDEEVADEIPFDMGNSLDTQYALGIAVAADKPDDSVDPQEAIELWRAAALI
jgi:hypothetical protein